MCFISTVASPSLEREQNQMCDVMCVGIVMGSMSTIMTACVFVCVRSFFLSVGATCCGHFPSYHDRRFFQTEGGVFCWEIVAIRKGFQLHFIC